MPAMLDDPASPTIYRVSGQPPYPDPNNPGLPAEMTPRQVTLRDRQTVATIVPFSSKHQVPESLIAYLCDQINKEIEGGDTYPMMDPFAADKFGSYWFQNFGAIMLLGDVERAEDVVEGKDWSRECLGSFYIKPNYPGRSSHVCNAGFLVTDASRNRGVGRLMGEAYLDWAPKLGYTYSVFNLVYETNVASCRIWDALGFKRIGRVKGCGNLRSYPNQLIDAIIYGRDLSPRESEELVSEERFDKIKFYLKYGEYPNGADRAEKSRLRSAATHYKLLDGDKLMLKDKEVISDPARQFDIARQVHVQQHGGINKTTATIAEKYHWSRIKETVSDVIRSCVECKELGKTPNPGGARKAASSNNHAGGRRGAANTGDHHAQPTSPAPTQMLPLQDHNMIPTISHQSPDHDHSPSPYANPADISLIAPPHAIQGSTMEHTLHSHSPMLQDPPTGHHPHDHNVYQPIDPQIINEASHDLGPFDQYHSPADFQALLNATEDVGPDVVDRDLEMLIEHQDDDNVMDGTDDMDGIGVDVGVGADNHGLVHKERGLYDVGFEGAGG
ncbi:acetyltransferase [Fusarium oxysporum f. sp. lycopersici 4287]|uniref:Acetyltransferase n=3 Tax=Fusarium oxysporum TaxID=5507 RepID=A0A0J9V336_FUSO4|nr:acetyltransferase [Fusarium oxysporum f. sp. lycopersici 4287]XP_018243985.1 acetyltransferase [Fusarium oxysporum f. sp. lycopersici 4287]EXK45185.1 acetyltransferase [Fusarium oxysporum f. sp. melonis 26406]KAJ9426727.1 acetyltransferase [Fusarium oxysporum]EXK45186.1 acetyltransferase [Fusarium oxysporum f. sp. melonis 26406]KNB05939.1 acetyltransferase [Fusarium oxysporum f. sp. lycopersici 4287]KNB05940.1 acetyltransferase [Fusarium oxysporum f. sp. lycopersici 4287]